MMRKTIYFILFILCSVTVAGCSHTLEVKNLDAFAVPLSIETPDKKINLGITSFDGNYKGIWYYNEIVQTLSSRPEIGKFSSNYISGRTNFKPDYIISINPDVKYKSSALNFLITCPGSFIFTPVWNGHVYYANIATSACNKNSVLRDVIK